MSQGAQQLSHDLPIFEVIVFASAQPEEFLGPHLLERWQTDRTLKDIIREVLKTVDYADGIPFQLDDQNEFVYSVLKNYKTLLIIDNLETTENPQRLLAFVRSLPQSVKVILTSRTRFGLGKTLSLNYLPLEPSLSFINHQAQKRLVSLDARQTKKIYQLSGGLPLAMAYSIGHLAVYGKLPTLGADSLKQQPSEMARYCVEASLKQLKNESAHRLLMAATLFTGKFSAQAATYIADLPSYESESYQELSDLYQLSLVNKLDESYYSLHSLTQEFVRAEFNLEKDFKCTAQKRWIDWYLKLLSPLEDNWLDWQDYSELEPEWNNVRSLMNWCIKKEEYNFLQKLWKGLRGYTLIRGYWEERQEWMGVLIAMAERKNDLEVLAQAMFYKGQTLAHMNKEGNTEKALTLLKASWEIDSWSEPEAKFGILTYSAALNTAQGNLEEAERWLDKRTQLSNVSIKESMRQECAYHYAIGEIYFKKKDYQNAKISYRTALTLSKKVAWAKLDAYITSWLATLLIKENKLNEAESLLDSISTTFEKHKDKRALAKCYYVMASLYEKKGNSAAFLEWTSLSVEQFEKLGMTAAVNQVKNLIDNSSLK